MNTATDTAIQAAAAIVEDYFTAPVRTLLDWVDPFAAEVFDARAAGPLTRSRIDALVEPHALRTLDLPASRSTARASSPRSTSSPMPTAISRGGRVRTAGSSCSPRSR